MAKKRDALKALERRKDYLEQKLETEEYSGRSYDLAEYGALEYAITAIEKTPPREN